MINKLKMILFIAFIGIIIIETCLISVFAADDISLSLSSALDSNGNGIAGGQITYFVLDNGGYGVRIDEIDFSGEWCSYNLADNRRCYYEIELWREGELFKEGNWLTEVIAKQRVAKNVITGDHCPSSLALIDPTQLISKSTTCPFLADFTTNFHITLGGKYFTKVRMYHNNFVSDWSTHESVFLNVEQTGTEDNTPINNFYSGYASESFNSDTWPFKLTVVGPDTNGLITGQIEWPSLNAIHKIEGYETENGMTFTETEYIKRGRAVLNCRYYLTLDADSFTGTWDSCGQIGTIFGMSSPLSKSYSGSASSSKDGDTWPFKLTVFGPDANGLIIGQIEWTSLYAIHMIEGSVTETGMVFTETGYIKDGGAILNCRYYLTLDANSFTGTWDSCGMDYGTISGTEINF